MVVSNHLSSRDVSDPSALRAAFDALPLSIVVLDATGVIVVANRAWREFWQRNGLRLEDSGVGTSYLQVCDTARGEGADDARAVGAAIRDALTASTVEHVLEYTCHSPVEQRWYLVRIQGTDVDGERRATVVHRDVTDRRKIEKARQMAARRELEALVDARTRELRVANEELHQAQASLSESEARFRAAANSTVDLIVEVDLRSDQLRWFGDVDGLLGYAPGEFPRTHSGFVQAHHPDDVERVRARSNSEPGCRLDVAATRSAAARGGRSYDQGDRRHSQRVATNGRVSQDQPGESTRREDDGGIDSLRRQAWNRGTVTRTS